MSLKTTAEVELAAGGRLRAPESLYENITKSTLAIIDDSFPASKGNLRASDSKQEAVNSELRAELKETTAVVNALVREVNALTPVGC